MNQAANIKKAKKALAISVVVVLSLLIGIASYFHYLNLPVPHKGSYFLDIKNVGDYEVTLKQITYSIALDSGAILDFFVRDREDYALLDSQLSLPPTLVNSDSGNTARDKTTMKKDGNDRFPFPFGGPPTTKKDGNDLFPFLTLDGPPTTFEITIFDPVLSEEKKMVYDNLEFMENIFDTCVYKVQYKNGAFIGDGRCASS